jgi:hypothetical protein
VSVILRNEEVSGTVTDLNGNNCVINAARDATLFFTFPGMVPQEIPINGRSMKNECNSDFNVAITKMLSENSGGIRLHDL